MEDIELGDDVPEYDEAEAAEGASEEPEEQLGQDSLQMLNDKYVRLYAEFDNYRKRVARDKKDLVKYANESLLFELLTSLDNLDTALEHASGDASGDGLREGVEMTRRELLRTLEKFGLKPIDALEMPFDPEFHHAVGQAESDDVDPGTVLEVHRAGYMYGDRVLRASMVTVSKKPSAPAGDEENKLTEIEEEEE